MLTYGDFSVWLVAADDVAIPHTGQLQMYRIAWIWDPIEEKPPSRDDHLVIVVSVMHGHLAYNRVAYAELSIADHINKNNSFNALAPGTSSQASDALVYEQLYQDGIDVSSHHRLDRGYSRNRLGVIKIELRKARKRNGRINATAPPFVVFCFDLYPTEVSATASGSSGSADRVLRPRRRIAPSARALPNLKPSRAVNATSSAMADEDVDVKPVIRKRKQPTLIPVVEVPVRLPKTVQSVRQGRFPEPSASSSQANPFQIVDAQLRELRKLQAESAAIDRETASLRLRVKNLIKTREVRECDTLLFSIYTFHHAKFYNYDGRKTTTGREN
ncbi:hypothetical protein EIP91_009962 [Steccherinum ochraceum]|uniref:Uncharacterized protein n=1 Tax=Steccherinum ochraceum TaxID=92696 RepID=A0A4R0R921_9APHY|nr:hypothetical protein EIP91_009962 [Steccherinum ochraceum]